MSGRRAGWENAIDDVTTTLLPATAEGSGQLSRSKRGLFAGECNRNFAGHSNHSIRVFRDMQPIGIAEGGSVGTDVSLIPYYGDALTRANVVHLVVRPAVLVGEYPPGDESDTNEWWQVRR